MKNSQKKIETEQLQTQICRLLIIHNEQRWTVNELAFTCMVPRADIIYCVHCLIDKEYLIKANGAYIITKQGREYTEGLKINSSFNTASSIAQHKEEALSGIVEKRSSASGFIVSEQSKLTKAVLPGAQKRVKRDVEQFALETSDKRKKLHRDLAKKLKLSEEELDTKIKEGLVGICKYCGEVEVFHKDGKYRTSKCRVCRRK